MRKLISIILIFSFIGFIYYNNTLYLLEEYFSDQLTKEKREVTNSIAILAVDEESLQKVGKWPWPRDIIAKTAKSLAESGATAVWLDFLYPEASQNPSEDNEMEKVVQKYPNIFLSSNFVFKGLQDRENELSYSKLNYPVFDVPANQIGHINVLPDRDGVVRNVLLGVKEKNGEIIPAISVKLVNLLLSEKQQINYDKQSGWQIGDTTIPTTKRNEMGFTYATAPYKNLKREIGRNFETIPIHKVINGEFDPAYFANRIVLIGPTAVGLQDEYFTPMSKSTKMFGVEIHANIIQSLLDQSFYSKLNVGIGLLLLLIIVILSYILFDRLKAKWGFVAFVGLTALYLAITLAVYHLMHLKLPFFYVMITIMFVYITSVVTHYLLERKERTKVTTLFGRYVSKRVVDEILSSKDEVKLGGVRKDVSLMFVDIRGFTPLSEKMEPEEVIDILNEYLDLGTRAVFAEEGTLDKFIGDGIMTIFGAPIEQKDHAIRAVRAALRMKKESKQLAKRLEEKYGRAIHFGIGINSGPAVIGNIGSHDRLDYTAIGDTVNLAARLESNAGPGQILISEQTFVLVKDQFKINEREPIKVKGKEQLVPIYEVEEER
ncbi:CHASE2 domain-containing protein [Bacillus sp. CGMCC 1.16607]|uniref:CHASE2 domain-containing protein n=1 Tax=Bacillus sp. CGMCC 1.16607 TaxID=3351842 RepID=UPI003628C731